MLTPAKLKLNAQDRPAPPTDITKLCDSPGKLEPTDISIPTEELEEAINIAYKDDETRNNNEEIKEPKKHAKKKEQSNEPIETKQNLLSPLTSQREKLRSTE